MPRTGAAVTDNGTRGVVAAVHEADPAARPATPVREARANSKGAKDKARAVAHRRDGSGRDVDVAVMDITGDRSEAWPMTIREEKAVRADRAVQVAVVRHAVSSAGTLEAAEAAGGPGRKTARAKEGRQAAARRAVSSSREASVPATARGARLGHAPPAAA